MPSQLADLPLAVSQLRPPYTEFSPVQITDRVRTGDLGQAPILALKLTRPSHDLLACRKWIPLLRTRFPAVPVILRVASQPDGRLNHVIGHALALKVRAVLADDESVCSSLPLQMTDPLDIGGDVCEWLALKGLRPSPDLLHLLSTIFSHAGEFRELSMLLRETGQPETSARFRCRKKGVPAPGRWFQAARALHAALRVQSPQQQSLQSIADDLGYADHSALSQQLRRTFGLRPMQIRQTLGWEWLLDRWVTRVLRSPTAAAAM